MIQQQHRGTVIFSALIFCIVLFISNPSIASAWSFQASNADTAQAQRISEFVAAQDWLGPISAIALSPFFGLACLSGIATYGPEWIRNSPLVSVSGPLNNPVLFWIMAALTVVTSLPRWTKFSKPIAMALEKVEAYSAIIILIAIRISASAVDASTSPEVAMTTPVLIQAGVLSLPLEILLSLALAINLIVVNTVKIVIDFLVWLTPIPAIDVILDAIGKGIVAILLGLYAFSPMLATFLNFLIFFFSAMVFFSAMRLIVYFREIYIRPTIQKVLGISPSSANLQAVFLMRAWNGYPRRTRAKWISSLDGRTSKLFVTRWFTAREFDLQPSNEKTSVGVVSDTALFNSENGPVALEARKGVFVINETIPVTPIPQGV
jgi:hypothetical protein